MPLVYSWAVAALFGAGAYALLQRDLIRIIMGVSLMSYAAILFLILAGETVGGAVPVHPVPSGLRASDPLVQSLVLTAVVINVSTTGVIIGFIHRAFQLHGTLDERVVTRGDARRDDP